MVFSLTRSVVDRIRFLINSIPLDFRIMKARKFQIVTHLIEILDPKYPFFWGLTKFQKCMFKRIHWICISADGLIRAAESRSLHIKVHCAWIEYQMTRPNLVIILFN